MTITSGDVALAGPLILGLMGVIVTFIPNNSIGNKRIYLIIAFVILYAITFGAQ
jgi:hypothetical protein